VFYHDTNLINSLSIEVQCYIITHVPKGHALVSMVHAT
jgi:hypothetical protein